jgi:hypothetical protein
VAVVIASLLFLFVLFPAVPLDDVPAMVKRDGAGGGRRGTACSAVMTYKFQTVTAEL